MPSPVSTAHAEPHAMIETVLLVYAASTLGVRGYDSATVRLDLDNEPQPDILLRVESEVGGRSQVSGDERQIDWFELADGEYRVLPADEAGVVHSRVFPGLRLAAGALLKGDLAAALADVQKGIGSPEHEAFAARLAAARTSG